MFSLQFARCVTVFGCLWLFQCTGKWPVSLGDELPNSKTSPAAKVTGRKAETDLELAWSFYRRGEWNQALATFDRIIAAEPKSLLPHVGRAYVYLAEHKDEKAIEAMWRAIRLNPNDLGVTYDPFAKKMKKLSAEALRHGEEQVRKMLHDRPAMAKYVSPQDMLWEWAVRKFAGEDIDGLVYWSPVDPRQRTAVCYHDGSRFSIQISPEYQETNMIQPRSFDDLWSDAVYELHNIVSLGKGEAIETQVMNNQLTCEEYSLAIIEVEKAAAEQTRAFYLKAYLPWLRTRSIATDPSRWHWFNFPPTDNRPELIKYWRTSSAWEYNSNKYALISANREMQRGNTGEARTILQSLKDHEPKLAASQASAMHYLFARLYELEGDHIQSVSEFTRAIASDPTNYSAALELGMVRNQMGRYAEAIDGLTKLMEAKSDWPDAYYERAKAYCYESQFDRAITDLNAAIKIEPDMSALFTLRGDAWEGKHEYERAIADYAEAIRLDPDDATTYVRRSLVREAQHKYTEALSDRRKAVSLDPDLVEAQWRLALLLAACPDDKIRDGKSAIEAATKACELTKSKDWAMIYALAVALAEAGRFNEAVAQTQEAIKLANNADEASRKELKDCLELFKQRRTVHQGK